VAEGILEAARPLAVELVFQGLQHLRAGGNRAASDVVALGSLAKSTSIANFVALKLAGDDGRLLWSRAIDPFGGTAIAFDPRDSSRA
jgi:hypothetical protein